MDKTKPKKKPKKITKEGMTEFLEAIQAGMDRENVELYERVLGDFDVSKIKTLEDFSFKVSYPFEQFMEGLITKHFSKNHDCKFIMMNYRFIESNFTRVYEQVEGFSCCADKGRTAVSRLFRFFKDGTLIQFDPAEEYTYHHPKLVLNNHNDIVAFYEGLQGLFYGNNTKYVNEYHKIILLLKAKNENTKRQES